jgi:hypothetical protein
MSFRDWQFRVNDILEAIDKIGEVGTPFIFSHL